MEVITLKPHRYKNKQKFKGDKYTFKATRQELRLALALGWVKEFFEVKLIETVANETKNVAEVTEGFVDPSQFISEFSDEEVEQVEVSVPDDKSDVVVEVAYKPKRTYKRRDMVSDE